MHRTTLLYLTIALASLATGAARADDVCTAAEYQAGEADLARAQAAEAAGNAAEALRIALNVRGCVDDESAQRNLIVRNSHQLGQAAEAAGNLEAAFDYYNGAIIYEQYENPKPFDVLANARRVALARIEAAPTDRQLASQVLQFMNYHQLADGVDEILRHIDAQARRVLAEEERVFTINVPQKELLTEVEDWLAAAILTGVPELDGKTRAALMARYLARGDQFAALDYHTALERALYYYEDAERADKQESVRAKARQLADQRAAGDNWAEAARLYELAGDTDKAQALTERREASAAEQEAERKEKFQAEQDDLEKELGF